MFSCCTTGPNTPYVYAGVVKCFRAELRSMDRVERITSEDWILCNVGW